MAAATNNKQPNSNPQPKQPTTKINDQNNQQPKSMPKINTQHPRQSFPVKSHVLKRGGYPTTEVVTVKEAADSLVIQGAGKIEAIPIQPTVVKH